MLDVDLRRAEAASDVVLLDGEDGPDVVDGGLNLRGVDRGDRVHVDDACRDAVLRQLFRCLQAGPKLGPTVAISAMSSPSVRRIAVPKAKFSGHRRRPRDRGRGPSARRQGHRAAARCGIARSSLASEAQTTVSPAMPRMALRSSSA